MPRRSVLTGSHARWTVLAVLVAGVSAGASADERVARPGDPCYCRAAGTNWKMGAAVCLAAPDGPRLAICDMVLNNTSWRITDRPCPEASLRPRFAG